MTASTSSALPSVKWTVPPSKWLMFGFTVMSPWPSLGSSVSDTVGCELNSLCSGLGRPKSVTLPIESFSSSAMIHRCVSRGMTIVRNGLIMSSAGLPNMNLGNT